MNFLGHCFVASWRRGVAPSVGPYAFGAMLPDFCGMARARVLHVDHRETAEGVALHHETDDVFHSSAPFTRLMEETRGELEAAEVRRGTALAVGHVGVELLLDGWMLAQDQAGDGTVGALYEAALAAGEPLCEHLRFKDAAGAERMRALLGRLRGYGLRGHREVDAIAERLDRALSARPRLRIEPGDRPAVRASLVHCEAKIAQRAPHWVEALQTALAGAGSPDRNIPET